MVMSVGRNAAVEEFMRQQAQGAMKRPLEATQAKIYNEDRLNNINPDLAKILRLADSRGAPDIGIDSGLRSQAEQNSLYNRGITPTTNSNHTKGHAVDLSMRDAGGGADWDFDKYSDYYNNHFKPAADELGVDAQWGGNWKSRDGVHFQTAGSDFTPGGTPDLMQGPQAHQGHETMLGGPQADSLSPNTEEGPQGTLMDRIGESLRSAEFNPGVGLQSLGAAIAAGSQGRSAAPQFAEIRAQYEKQQNYLAEKAQEQMENQAAMELFKDDPEMLAAIEAGLPLAEAMKIRNQKAQFEQQLAVQTNQFAQEEKMQGIISTARAGENAADRAARLELAQGGWLRTDIQLAERIRMNNESIDQWGVENGQRTEQLKIDNARWTDEFALKEGEYLRDRQNEEVAGTAGQIFVAEQYERMGMPEDAKRVREMAPAAFSDPAMMARFTDLMTVPADKDGRTAKAKDWELYQKIVAQDGQEAGDAFLASSGSGNTFNLGNKADVEWVKSDAATMKSEREAITESQGSLDALNQMSVILANNPNLNSGPLMAKINPALSMLNDAGLLPTQFQKDTLSRAELGQLGTYLATTIKTPGSVSDYEQKAFKAAMPGPETPEELLTYVVDYHAKRLERASKRAVFMENNMRSGEGMGYSAAQDKWETAKKAGAPETMPLYADADTFTAENLDNFDFSNSRAMKIGGKVVPINNEAHARALIEKKRRSGNGG